MAGGIEGLTTERWELWTRLTGVDDAIMKWDVACAYEQPKTEALFHWFIE